MNGPKCDKRFTRIGVACFLLAGSSIGVAILLFATRPSAAPETGRIDDRGEEPIAAGLVRAIRNADAQAIRKLLADGADVNGRDGEGNTPLILASFYASPQCVQ